MLTVLAEQQIVVVAAFRGEGIVHFSAGQRIGTDGDRFRKTVLDPGMCAGSVERQLGTVRNIAVRKLFQHKAAATGRDRRGQFGQGAFFLRYADRHHGNIFVPGSHFLKDRGIHARIGIQEFADRGVGRRQGDGLAAAAFHFQRTPRELFHGVGRFHPRPARGAPARRRGDAGLHAQRIGQADGEGEILPPILTQIGCLLHHRRKSLHHRTARIKLVQARDAAAVQPFQVLADAVPGCVPVDPVPPHIRSRFTGRVFKIIERDGAILGKGSQCIPE